MRRGANAQRSCADRVCHTRMVATSIVLLAPSLIIAVRTRSSYSYARSPLSAATIRIVHTETTYDRRSVRNDSRYGDWGPRSGPRGRRSSNLSPTSSIGHILSRRRVRQGVGVRPAINVLRSLPAKRWHRIDRGRVTSGNQAGQKRNGTQDDPRCQIRRYVEGPDSVQQRADDSRRQRRKHDPRDRSSDRELATREQDHGQNLSLPRAQRDTNADLLGALRNHVRHDPVEPDGGERERHH